MPVLGRKCRGPFPGLAQVDSVLQMAVVELYKISCRGKRLDAISNQITVIFKFLVDTDFCFSCYFPVYTVGFFSTILTLQCLGCLFFG